jgi:FkbM family methyltransferase
MLVRGRHGFFVILPDDLIVGMSLLIYGEYHEMEWQFLKRYIKHGQTIVDMGANLGTFTVPFAHAVGPKGKVISFEPQPVIFECLKNTIALNKFQNVELHNACVGNEETTLEIFEPDYASPGNFSGVPFREAGYGEVVFSNKRITVPCTRLDSVLAGQKVDIIKADIEGMELEALMGAENAITSHHPVLYLENNRRDKSPALIKWLEERGYKMWWHTGAFFNPHNFTKHKENIYGKRHNVNMIALHYPGQQDLLPKSLRPVQGPDDHIIDEGGGVLPSFADDVTGI